MILLGKTGTGQQVTRRQVHTTIPAIMYLVALRRQRGRSDVLHTPSQRYAAVGFTVSRVVSQRL